MKSTSLASDIFIAFIMAAFISFLHATDFPDYARGRYIKNGSVFFEITSSGSSDNDTFPVKFFYTNGNGSEKLTCLDGTSGAAYAKHRGKIVPRTLVITEEGMAKFTKKNILKGNLDGIYNWSLRPVYFLYTATERKNSSIRNVVNVFEWLDGKCWKPEKMRGKISPNGNFRTKSPVEIVNMIAKSSAHPPDEDISKSALGLIIVLFLVFCIALGILATFWQPRKDGNLGRARKIQKYRKRKYRNRKNRSAAAAGNLESKKLRKDYSKCCKKTRLREIGKSHFNCNSRRSVT